MAPDSDFKGHYCRKCRTYSRIYLDSTGRMYRGTCHRCGKKILFPAQLSEEILFQSGNIKKTDLINIWDDYRGGKIIGQLLIGTRAQTLETREFNGVTWYRVKAGKLTGWVSGAFIRKLK